MQRYPVRLLLRILKTYHYRITIKRIWNSILAGFSIICGKIFRIPVVFNSPVLLMVEPTNICNLKCPMCPSGAGELTRPKGKMDFSLFKKAIDEIGDKLLLIQFWNQGEPFINKSFLDMVFYAKSKGISTMTSTNGHFIKSIEDAEAIIHSGLDEIIISIDGLDQETYSRYRFGGDLETVIKGIELLVNAKMNSRSKRPLISIQFLVMKQNESQKELIIETARQWGADIVILKSIQVYNKEQEKMFLPDDEKFIRYDIKNKSLKVKGDYPNWCQFIWNAVVLNWDGSVAPCCFDKDNTYLLGNLGDTESSLENIWKNDNAHKFRSSILKNRAQHQICRNCFQGMPQNYGFYEILK